ncbi:putative AMP-binding enzyme [Rosellinia necatrix]|uniref:Putative AMP-binding enzyme n=1 Tax=Rosellinia necatrix TaxID=77044 RepID=A0A1W2TTP5_ROSNE|nr:putative AMP-binding enzyme [Rosellinia necatrix]
MASTIERKANGEIIYGPSEVLDVPNVDLMTLLFESENCRVPADTILHADAAEPSHHLTKAKLLLLSKRIAHVLRNQYGIGADGSNKDVVFNISTGNFLIPALFYSIITAGGVFASASAAATPNEFAYQLRQSGAKVVVCNADVKETALAAAAMVGIAPRHVLVYGVGTGGDGMELHEAASGAKVPISNQELGWRRITDPVELENSIICLVFSSGTTGLPKAMRLSHRNSVAACALSIEPARQHNLKHKPGYKCRFPTSSSLPDEKRHGPKQSLSQKTDLTLAHLPTAHIAGIQGYLVNSCYLGGTCFWMRRFEFARFCEHARRHRVTTMFTVPPIYLLIAKSAAVADHFDSWDDAVTGAAPMGRDLQLAAGRKIGGGATLLRQTWGLSETTGSITIVPIELAHVAPAGSVGSLIASCYARLVDDDGRDVAPGEAGEIWVKGPVVTKGYWNNEAANRESFSGDGWFCTGDIAVFKDGFFSIVDRKKELIKYKGNQVAPAELEAMLISHPKILDVAVIGVPGEGTEVPRAYVVADEKEISGKEIVEWFGKQGLSRYKQLRGGVVFLDAIPKSPAGKILRKNLRELAKRERPVAKI